MAEKFTAMDLDLAIARLATCEYFPSGAGDRAAIAEALVDMCPHREALVWLTKTFRDRVGKWRGAAELRGVLCWRFKPADGIERDCSIPGFTAADGEAKALEEHGQLLIGGWNGDETVKRLAEARQMPKGFLQ